MEDGCGVVLVSAVHVTGPCNVSSAADVLCVSVVRWARGVCGVGRVGGVDRAGGVGGDDGVCVWFGAALLEMGCVDERNRLGIYQSCVNKRSVRRVSVFGLRCWLGGVGGE